MEVELDTEFEYSYIKALEFHKYYYASNQQNYANRWLNDMSFPWILECRGEDDSEPPFLIADKYLIE